MRTPASSSYVHQLQAYLLEDEDLEIDIDEGTTTTQLQQTGSKAGSLAQLRAQRLSNKLGRMEREENDREGPPQVLGQAEVRHQAAVRSMLHVQLICVLSGLLPCEGYESSTLCPVNSCMPARASFTSFHSQKDTIHRELISCAKF